MSAPDPPSYPAFRHQLKAMLARQAQEDREAIGATLRRLRYGLLPEDEGTRPLPPRAAATRANEQSRSAPASRIDFRHVSPITSVRRQSDQCRIPHLSVTHITRTVVPRSASGNTHPRYPERSTVAAEHHDYLTEGARASYRTHYDYISRLFAPQGPDDQLPPMDMMDFEENYREREALAILSNIPGGPERQRNLFEAAEAGAESEWQLFVGERGEAAGGACGGRNGSSEVTCPTRSRGQRLFVRSIPCAGSVGTDTLYPFEVRLSAFPMAEDAIGTG